MNVNHKVPLKAIATSSVTPIIVYWILFFKSIYLSTNEQFHFLIEPDRLEHSSWITILGVCFTFVIIIQESSEVVTITNYITIISTDWVWFLQACLALSIEALNNSHYIHTDELNV